MKEMLARLSAKLGKGRWFFLLGALGAVLLLLVPTAERTEQKETIALDIETYRAALTGEITALCESVRGAGEATVFITLASGECAIYERDEKENGSLVASVGSEPLLIGYEMPRINGVAIVCDGGGSESVKYAIVTLLTASLDISAAQIAVAPSK